MNFTTRHCWQIKRLRRNLAWFTYAGPSMASCSRPESLRIRSRRVGGNLQWSTSASHIREYVADYIHACRQKWTGTKGNAESARTRWSRHVRSVKFDGTTREFWMFAYVCLHFFIISISIFFSSLFHQFLNNELVTEVSAAKDVDRARYAIRSNRGLAFETTVAFGPHGAIPNYQTFNESDLMLTGQNTIIVHSGGQYLEGTTEVTRTCNAN